MVKEITKIHGVMFLLFIVVLTSSFTKFELAKDEINTMYLSLGSSVEKPNYEVFETAVQGYINLNSKNLIGERNLLTIIDFSVSANKKRLWVIDLDNEKVIHHTLVAHGRNTGQEYAQKFSNTPESYQSSLGFYVTCIPVSNILIKNG